MGEVDFGVNVGFDGIFAPLRDADYFSLVTVSPDLGTVVWPNGADLDPAVLHSAVLQRASNGRAAAEPVL